MLSIRSLRSLLGWDGSDVFIIGGGPSLAGFDWTRLRGHHSIGCNAAFLLGSQVCSLCFFSDYKWFLKFEDRLADFCGPIVSHSSEVPLHHPYIIHLPKSGVFGNNDKLFYGDGGNSGGSALHLALLLGARRVLLLGFDGHLGDQGQPNWHAEMIEAPHQDVYQKFQEDFDVMARISPQLFPGTEIINCNPASRYPQFPKKPLEEVLP